jgi:hypothetical protein
MTRRVHGLAQLARRPQRVVFPRRPRQIRKKSRPLRILCSGCIVSCGLASHCGAQGQPLTRCRRQE